MRGPKLNGYCVEVHVPWVDSVPQEMYLDLAGYYYYYWNRTELICYTRLCMSMYVWVIDFVYSTGGLALNN